MKSIQKRPVFSCEQFPTAWQLEDSALPTDEQAYRQQAHKASAELPMPSRNNPLWQWVDFSALNLTDLPCHLEGFAQIQPLQKSYPGLVFESLAQSIQVARPELKKIRTQVQVQPNDKLSAIIPALTTDGLFLYLPRGMRIDETLVASLFSGIHEQASFSQTILYLDEDASCELLLEFISPAGTAQGVGFHAGQVSVFLAPGASLKLYETQDCAQQIDFISYEHAVLSANSQLEWVYGSLGARQSKNFITVDMIEANAQADLKGFYFAESGQLQNIDTRQNHFAPNCTSNLLYKGAGTGKGQSIWEGMIHVSPQAIKTNGYQSNKNLLLSDEAILKSIPGLEILASDVACSHATTAGNIDPNELYYLQTRGIAPDEAESLIVAGFFSTILDTIPKLDLRERLSRQINDKYSNQVTKGKLNQKE